MADANLRAGTVSARSVRTTDVIAAFDPAETDAAAAARTDTLAEVIRTALRNVPTDLTVGERSAIRAAITALSSAAGSVGTTELADDAVTADKLADDAVDGGKLDDTDTTLAAELVTLLGLPAGNDRLDASAIKNLPTGGSGLDQAAVDARVAAGVADWAETGNAATVPSAKLTDGSVGTAKIADDAVTQAKVAAGAVGTTELADDAVNADKLTAGAVGGAAIADDGIEGGKLDDTDTTLAGEIVTLLGLPSGADRLDASAIKNLPTGGAGLNQAAVDARVAALVDDYAETANASTTIPAAKLTDGSVGTAKLADDAVTQAKVADNAVDADRIDGTTPAKQLAIRTKIGVAETVGVPVSATPRQDMFTPSLAATSLTDNTEVQVGLTAAAPAAPYSVASNAITVAAGTADYLAVVDWTVEIDPTAWVTAPPPAGTACSWTSTGRKTGSLLPSPANQRT